VAAEPDLVSGYLHARDELENSSVSTFRDHFLERARNRAEMSANRFSEAGFKVDVLIRLGDAGPQICSVADENHLDCVVLGRKGHGSVRERLLGSVSHYVIHHAVCPVTLVPPRDDGSL
jgi:nucleotide-binding universal stress UspA family protein